MSLDFEYNLTPRLRREVRQIIFEHFDQIVAAWREHLEVVVQSKIQRVFANAIEATPEALIVVVEMKPVSIPWEMCSERLARASQAERSCAELSPSGYGIHWPLIDEDLAVGPLVQKAA